MEDRTLLSAGALDTTFGNGGIASTSLNGSVAVLVQPDDKVLEATTIGLARFNADGTPDMSFGTGGQAVTDFNVADAALTPDGKIVVVGDALARYTATGTLDTSFGMGGEVIPSFGSISDVAEQADGKIVVLGSQALVRYNTDGSLDTSFGSGGAVNIQFGTSLILQANGRLVVAAGDQVSKFELAPTTRMAAPI
jgi:uncharacterized delta-60 repeat protein